MNILGHKVNIYYFVGAKFRNYSLSLQPNMYFYVHKKNETR